MWIEGFLIGSLIGPVSVWLGLAAIPLVAGLLIWIAFEPKGRPRGGGALLGLAAGWVLATMYAGAACPTAIGFESSSCSGPDLRFMLVLAGISATVGAILTYQRMHQ